MSMRFPGTKKIVFATIAGTACGTFIVGILPVEHFMTLAGAAFAFYFSDKDDSK